MTEDEPSVKLSPRKFEESPLEADAVLTAFGPVRWARPGSGWYNKRTKRGSIVILHDGGARGRRTAEVLRRILPEIKGRGFRFVTLSELVESGDRTSRVTERMR